MFEWLEQELAEINTPSFHLVDGRAPETVRQERLDATLLFPPSYREFIVRFGNAKLCKHLSYYRVGVRALPEAARSSTDESLSLVGHYEGSRAYVKDALLQKGQDSPVFEWGSRFSLAAPTCQEWLVGRCKAARRRYGRKEWAEILRGPVPFNREEQAVVEARRQYKWRLVETTERGVLRFEVKNGSTRMLPYLSIGVRTRDRRLIGAVWLPVAHIRPQATAIVEKEGYIDLTRPDEVEVFALPDPEPQDRDRYWEFRPLSVL